MRRKLLVAMVLGLTVASMGCAATLNVQDASRCKPYGGVAMPLTEFFGGDESGEAAEFGAFLFWPFWLLDKPLSFVVDTLTLPYTLYVQRDTLFPARKPRAKPTRCLAPPGLTSPRERLR